MPAEAPEYSITLTREVNAAAKQVYAAWTEQATMERWLGKVSAEIRVGGHYRFERSAEGGQTHLYTGEYLAIEDGRRIVQSFLAGEPDRLPSILIQMSSSKSAFVTLVRHKRG